MASLVAKKKGNQLYYYVVESARVEGKPRIVQQTYLGTADRLAELLKERTAPVPLSATTRELGLPGALWQAAQRSGVWDVLKAMWPEPRSGPSHSALSLVGHHPPHLSARSQDGGCGLVSIDDFATRYGPSLPNDFARRISGTPLIRSMSKVMNVAEPMNWKRRRCGCWPNGKRKSWSAAGCWLTTRLTFIPGPPAPISAIASHNEVTTNRDATICGKSD